jgi:acetylornithine deacetylase/succinyl-diaminopimelate desuccinylase-like protein
VIPEQFMRFPEIADTLQQLADCRPMLLELTQQLQQIPAPTGAEHQRAAWVERRLREVGLADVQLDELPNVYARIPGARQAPTLLVSAHTDTVFPLETDLAVRNEPAQERLYGPGMGDNSAGVASLLLLAQTLQRLPPPPVDIWLVANCGEEGLGDLRGMRSAVDRLAPHIGACVVIEGAGLKRVVYRGLGSRRYRISVKAPGGHSWSDFGAASAVHVLVQLAAELTQLAPPAQPRTTFNIGRISGGASINTIAQSAELELDLRSEEATALQKLVDQTLAIVQRVQATWRNQEVLVSAAVIGDRPSGEIKEEHPLVQAAYGSLHACGVTTIDRLSISSTDANIPLSRGIPAVCIGVSEGGNAHRVEEWLNTALLPVGMQHLLQLTWWAARWLASTG